MARPSRAVCAARHRWVRTRRIREVKARLVLSLKNTLCDHHYTLLEDDVFLEELEEVCTMIAEADESVETEVCAFFPAEGMSQEIVRAFKTWLKSDMGTPIAVECLEWSRFIIRSFLSCATCRGAAPILIDSDSDAD